MAESPSSPSSKALLSLISSTSPSPISCSEFPVCNENYLPYVLVKGSMDEPRCSKTEQRKPCNEEKRGIVKDEALSKTSSLTIPLSVFLQSKGDEHNSQNFKSSHGKGDELNGKKSLSLPPSPIKSTRNAGRSIEDLRIAVQQMKESSMDLVSVDQTEEMLFDHLPMELRQSEEHSTRDKTEEIFLHQPGKSSTGSLPQTPSAVNLRLKKKHGPDKPSFYPVKQLTHEYKPPSIVNPLPPFQTYKAISLANPNNPPTGQISNQIEPSACQLRGHVLNTEYPPLPRAHKVTSSQKPNPSEPNSPVTNHKTAWNQLFASNRIRTNGANLEFIPITPSQGKTTIKIQQDEVSEELERWSNALVGYVIGAKPPFKLMEQFVERRWKAFGHIEVFILKAGLFIFNFPDEETKLKVLELGPWSYFDKPLILKPWSSSESYDRLNPESMPIWVRLPQLKLHLWSATALSKIGSHIGKPLFTDRMTAARQRLSFARICVEVNTSSSFPTSIEIEDHDGSSFVQPIEYEWIPTRCELCKQFGHKQNQCSRGVKKEWRPKPKEVDEPKAVDEPKGQAPHAEVKKHPNEQPSPAKAETSNALIISNQFGSLEQDAIEEDALSISPLAIDQPHATTNQQPCTLNQGTNERSHPLQEEAQLTPPLPSKLEYDQPLKIEYPEASLSKTQRKKLNKMHHAEEQRGSKAFKAKAHSPSPSSK